MLELSSLLSWARERVGMVKFNHWMRETQMKHEGICSTLVVLKNEPSCWYFKLLSSHTHLRKRNAAPLFLSSTPFYLAVYQQGLVVDPFTKQKWAIKKKKKTPKYPFISTPWQQPENYYFSGVNQVHYLCLVPIAVSMSMRSNFWGNLWKGEQVAKKSYDSGLLVWSGSNLSMIWFLRISNTGMKFMYQQKGSWGVHLQNECVTFHF